MTTALQPRIAVSNLAWAVEDDWTIAPALRDSGATGVELAPTKRWPDLSKVSTAEAIEHRMRWAEHGLPIVAFQALLFGRPDLVIFDSPERREATARYLVAVIELAGTLGASVLVFGSPGNRRRGSLDRGRAEEIAIPFFRELGRVAADAGTTLCIEPNPPEYGCDWIVSAMEADAFVDAVGTEGFGLHLDAGALTMTDAGEDIERVRSRLRHFHVSEPRLAPVGTLATDHARYGDALRRIGFDGWCSIEMRPVDHGSVHEAVRRAVDLALEAYGPQGSEARQ